MSSGSEKRGDLEVTVMESKSISDSKSASLYCLVDFPHNKQAQSNMCKDLKWNQVFSLDCMTFDSQELIIQVFKSRRLRGPKFCGQIQTTIAALNVERQPKWFPLTDRPQNGAGAGAEASPAVSKAKPKPAKYVSGEILLKFHFVHRLMKDDRPSTPQESRSALSSPSVEHIAPHSPDENATEVEARGGAHERRPSLTKTLRRRNMTKLMDGFSDPTTRAEKVRSIHMEANIIDQVVREKEQAINLKLDQKRTMVRQMSVMIEKSPKKEDAALKAQLEQAQLQIQQLESLLTPATQRVAAPLTTLVPAPGANASDEEMQALRARCEKLEADLLVQQQVSVMMSSLVSKLEKLDKLDAMMHKLDNLKIVGGGGGGGGGGGDSDSGSRGYAEIKADLAEIQKIIFDEENKFSDKEKEDANIRYEKMFQELTQTYEYKAEIQAAIDEKRRINEPLNKAALEKMILIYNPEKIAKDPELKDKVMKTPELTLIGMDPKAILAKHQNDFQQYTLRNADLDELRAIRASLPKFRNDQKRQMDWLESLENKIEQISKNPPKPKAPPKAPAKKFAPKPPPAGAPTGDIFAEILAKRKGQPAGEEPAAPTEAKAVPEPKPLFAKIAPPPMKPPPPPPPKP